MITKIYFFISLAVLHNFCDAYKLLVIFPIPGKSHAILGEGIVKNLLKAGHEVTYITPVIKKNPPPNLRQIDVSSHFELVQFDKVMDLQKFMNNDTPISDTTMILRIMASIAQATLAHENVQNLLKDPKEQFDAAIVEWMYNDLYAGFGPAFNCPLIWSSSMEPHQLVMSLIDEGPNPAYAADVLDGFIPPYTFWERVTKLYNVLRLKYTKWLLSSADNEKYNEAFKSVTVRRGYEFVPLDEAKYNGALMLGNSHVSAGQALSLPQNYIPIAGYHIEDKVEPLPQDLQKIMDESKHGVIYFSMGSMLKSKTLPLELKKGVLKVFEGLKQTVIWKFEEKLDNLPKNVHILNWAPQQSILAHPNCVLFITHGGFLSTTETLHFGIPIIGIPMYADQFANVNTAAAKGFAKRVHLNIDLPKNLKAAIEEMTENPSYRQRVKELSLVYHDRPVSPAVSLVFWVEHVVRTRGALHLRSPALHVPFYQKLYLDLAAVILITCLIFIKLVKFCMKSKKRDEVKKRS